MMKKWGAGYKAVSGMERPADVKITGVARGRDQAISPSTPERPFRDRSPLRERREKGPFLPHYIFDPLQPSSFGALRVYDLRFIVYC